MSTRTKLILFSVVFTWLFYRMCCHYYPSLLSMGPSLIHAWAQGDRYSLALNFYDHGMDFFHPRTSNIHSTDGITGVEFPIQAYLAAICGHLFGRENISISFRLITVAISFAGLYALFLAVYKRTSDVIAAVTIPAIIFSAPVFIYYTCNYLPDTAGTSLAFIAIYFILKYHEEQSPKSYYIALAFLMFGALIKTTIAVYLLGFIGFVFLSRLSGNGKKTLKNTAGFVLMSTLFVLPVVAYYFYNQYLNNTYHSHIFMSKPAPFQNMQQFREYVDLHFKTRWMYDYLAVPDYMAAATMIAAGFVLAWKMPQGKRQLSLFFIFLGGSAAMFYLLGAQLLIHDYYIIAIAFPPLAYGLIISLLAIRKNVHGIAVAALRASLLAAIYLSFIFGFHQHGKRFNDSTDLYRWSLNGKALLDELHIGRDEPIFLVNEFPSNLPLAYFDRRGETFYYDKWDGNMHYPTYLMRQSGIRVAVMRTQSHDYILAHFPETLEGFEHLLTKDELVVYRLKD